MFPPQIVLQTWVLFSTVEEEKVNQFVTNSASRLSKFAHSNLVLFLNITPSFDRNCGFIISSWHNHSFVHDGYWLDQAMFQTPLCLHDWTKLSFKSMEWWKAFKNYNLIVSFRLPHVEGTTLNIMYLKIFFPWLPTLQQASYNKISQKSLIIIDTLS